MRFYLLMFLFLFSSSSLASWNFFKSGSSDFINLICPIEGMPYRVLPQEFGSRCERWADPVNDPCSSLGNGSTWNQGTQSCAAPPPPAKKKAHFIPGPTNGSPFSPSIPGHTPGSGTQPTSTNPSGFLPHSIVDDEGNVWDPDPGSINCVSGFGCTATYSPGPNTVDPNDPSTFPPGTIKNGSTGVPNAIRPDGTVDYESDPFACTPSCFPQEPDPTSPYVFDKDTWKDNSTNAPSIRTRTSSQESDGTIRINDKTVTTNPNGTTTTKETVTSKDPNGVTTTTTTETEKDAEGNVTSTKITGESTVQNDDQEEGRGVGGGMNCATPPVCKGDAIECAIVDQTWNTRCAIAKEGDGAAYGQAVDGLGDGISDAINEYGNSVEGKLSEDLGEFGLDASSAQSAMGLLSSSGCQDLSFAFHGQDMSISCSKTSGLRDISAFAFGFMTVLYIFRLMVRPVGGV